MLEIVELPALTCLKTVCTSCAAHVKKENGALHYVDLPMVARTIPWSIRSFTGERGFVWSWTQELGDVVGCAKAELQRPKMVFQYMALLWVMTVTHTQPRMGSSHPNPNSLRYMM